MLYRSIWSDDRAGLVSAALAAFRDWVTWKSDGALVVPDGGRSVGTTLLRSRRPDGSWQVSAQPAETALHRTGTAPQRPVVEAARATLIEMRDDGSRWSTSMRVWLCAEPENPDMGEGAGWLWVDVEAVSSESLAGAVIAAPRLVADLINGGQQPRRRCVSFENSARRYEGKDGAEVLAALLSHADRDLPIVVFSDDPTRTRLPLGPPFFDDAVGRVATRALGLAAVAVVDPAASSALSLILGPRHSVWGGAFRTYLPGLDPATDRDEWRHRYVTADRYLRYRDTAAILVARALSPAAAARRAPVSYAEAKQLLDDARHADAGELADLLALADEQAAQQRSAAAAQEDRYFDLLGDYEKALEDRARSAAVLDEVRRRLHYAESLIPAPARGNYHQFQPLTSNVPVTAATLTQAAHQAQEHLADHLELPADACVDLDQLDAALEAGPWGQTSWEAFRALHAYAAELATGKEPSSFWTWCEQSGHALAWRATPKKLSMTESQAVENNDKLRRHRVLPVNPAVDPSGRVYMAAHIKIAEGGGPLAPRIYFMVSRVTGKAHVGYFGPHRNMPNTKT